MQSFDLMKISKSKTSIIENLRAAHSAHVSSNAGNESSEEEENSIFANSPIAYGDNTSKRSKNSGSSGSVSGSGPTTGKAKTPIITITSEPVVPKQEVTFATVM